MNGELVVALVGIGVTVAALMFVLIAVVDGFKTAIFVIVFTGAACALLTGVVLFWLWVAGALS